MYSSSDSCPSHARWNSSSAVATRRRSGRRWETYPKSCFHTRSLDMCASSPKSGHRCHCRHRTPDVGNSCSSTGCSLSSQRDVQQRTNPHQPQVGHDGYALARNSQEFVNPTDLLTEITGIMRSELLIALLDTFGANSKHQANKATT